jgi:hypothetical protein
MNLTRPWHSLKPNRRFKELLDAAAFRLQQELEETEPIGSSTSPDRADSRNISGAPESMKLGTVITTPNDF